MRMTASQSERWSSPIVNPIASSSRLIEMPSEQNEPVSVGDSPDLLTLASVFVYEHPRSEQGEHRDRDVVGSVADQLTERAAEKQADDRHRHLKARHHEADAQAHAGRQPRVPSGAETAKVSSPSGRTNRISLSTAGRGYP
jgi:hypothetical protein